jgi:hypothetical protein
MMTGKNEIKERRGCCRYTEHHGVLGASDVLGRLLVARVGCVVVFTRLDCPDLGGAYDEDFPAAMD